MDQNDLQSTDIQAIIDAHEGRVHNQDVGPLFGHLAMLVCELRHDAVTQSRYKEAVAAALASDACQLDGQTLVWTRLMVRVRQSQQRTTEEVAAHPKMHNRRRQHASPRLSR